MVIPWSQNIPRGNNLVNIHLQQRMSLCFYFRCVSVQRWEQSDWLEVWTTALVQWKSTAMAAGGRCAITAGIKTWPPWCAPCCGVVPSRSNIPSLFLLLSTTEAHCGSMCAIQTCRISGSARRSSTKHTCARTRKHLGSSVTVSDAVSVFEVFNEKYLVQQ